MAGTSNDPTHDCMELNSVIPVPTMVTHSLLPYAPPSRDLLTAVPAEVMEHIASNLDASSIRAFRITNKAAKEKCEFSFVKACLHTLNIVSTKIGFRRGLKHVQTEWAGTALKQVIFTMPEQSNGIRPDSKFIVPSRSDIKAVIENIPNITTLVLRDPTGWSGMSNTLCQALTNSPRKNLTDLTIDGCMLSVRALTTLLNAHRKTLRYLVLRNVQCKDGDYIQDLLKSLASDFDLATLVLDSLVEKQFKFTMVDPSLLTPNNNYCLSVSRKAKKTGVLQRYVLMQDSASMTGRGGVKDGIARILKR